MQKENYTITKKAEELQVGDQVPDEDGFLWEVTEIEKQGDFITVTFKSDFSDNKDHRTSGPGMIRKFYMESDIIL